MDDRRPSMRRPTMTDVAARAGVSLKSVSRVVNAEAHVSPDLAHRVHEAITALGYRPDLRARELAAERPAGRLIGFVQDDAANPFFSAVHRGLEDVVRDDGVLVLAGSTDADPAREAALIATLIEFRVDGLVVAGAGGGGDLLRREIEHGTPVVCVDRAVPELTCDTVVSSNRDSTNQAVRSLRELGHRRIGFVGGDQRVWTAVERLAGYRDALRETGMPPDPRLEVLDVDGAAQSAAAVEHLLAGPEPPTALFTAQDRLTAGAVTALHRADRQHDIALFGFDEIPFAEELDPSVSVVAQDPSAMGQQAGRLLLTRLAGRGGAGPGRQHVLSTTLRHRRSGRIRPAPAAGSGP